MLAIRARASSAVILHVVPGTTLSGSELRSFRLRRALLAGFDLRGANLESADLTGSDLREADLRGANLGGAVLSGTLLEGALYDEGTRWPAGFDPAEAGAVRKDGEVRGQPSPAELEALRLGEMLRAREVRRLCQSSCRRSHHLNYLAKQTISRCRSTQEALEKASSRKSSPCMLKALMFMRGTQATSKAPHPRP